jgi:hypothetical protein
MGETFTTIWNLREFCVRDNIPSPIQQVRVPIRLVLTLIWGLPNLLRHVVPLICHVWWYPGHHCHLQHASLVFSSTPQPSLPNTMISCSSISLHVIMKHWHQLQHAPSTAYTESSIHQIEHTPNTVYTKYSIYRVQHAPKIVYLAIILMITSSSLHIASVCSVRYYTIDRHCTRSTLDLKHDVTLSQS